MTPSKNDLHELGSITKLHGFRGELTAFLDTRVLNDYKKLPSLFLEIKGQFIPYIVKSLGSKTNKTVKLKLEGVDTEDAAKALVKAKIYILKEEMSEGDEAREELRHLGGFKVFDENRGETGVVLEILELAGNPQMQIECEGKRIFLPLQGGFIKSIDQEKKEVHIAAPPGLIELYLD